MAAKNNETEIRVGTPKTNKVVAVDVHEDDARPWDLDTAHSIVGTDVAKVTVTLRKK